MLHNQPIHPLNAIINKACSDYYTGKVLPGYSVAQENCVYYSKESNDTISRCIIGSILPDKIAKRLSDYNWSINWLVTDKSYRARKAILTELFELIKADYFVDYDESTKEENRLDFIIDLQNSHDSFLLSKDQPLLESSNLAVSLWDSMKNIYPHLMTVHFLHSEL